MWKMKQNKNKQKTNTLKLVFKHSPHSVLWLSGICENHRYVIYFQERWCIRNFILKKSQLLLHSNQPNMFDSWLTKVFSPFYFTTAVNPLPTSKIIQLFFYHLPVYCPPSPFSSSWLPMKAGVASVCRNTDLPISATLLWVIKHKSILYFSFPIVLV